MFDKTSSNKEGVMLDEFEKYLLEDFPDIRNRSLYLAVSGGKDSMVLSYLLRQFNLDHTLLHCNFQLRGKEADEDEKFLLTYAKTYDLSIEIKRFDTYEIAEETNQTIQETARNLRYEWFRTFAVDGQVLILTAHHLDDSIETFFINLLRGAGIKGIKGIPKINLPFYRPLLPFTSNSIFKYIDEHGIDYREDSTNAESKYLRNRLRHSLLPLLIELEPSFKTKMRSFFSEIADVNTYLSERIESVLSDIMVDAKSMSIEKLKSYPDIILQLALTDFGIKRSNFKSFLNFLNSESGSEFNSDLYKFSRDREVIFFSELSSNKGLIQIQLDHFPQSLDTDFGLISFEIVDVEKLTLDNNPIHIDIDKVQLPILVRNWHHGDKITPLGMSGKKLISDVLIDNKIPQFRKHQTLVIEDANKVIIAIPGLMINEYFKSDQLTKQLLQVTLSETQ